MNNRVVHINDLKEEKSMKAYLNVLSFNQLITESNELVDQLKKNPLSPSLINKASLVLKEIKSRLHSDTPEISLSELNLKLKSFEQA